MAALQKLSRFHRAAPKSTGRSSKCFVNETRNKLICELVLWVCFGLDMTPLLHRAAKLSDATS